MEPEIWVIVRNNVVANGESYHEMVLCYKGYNPQAIYPAFLSKKAAQSYIDDHKILGRPEKVEVWEE